MNNPIVSSAHLVSEKAAELSEYEFGLIIANNAFSRWTTRCMAAAGEAELSALEILVLHSCNHRDREKRLSDLCFVLNIEDTHTVNYALKKLLKADLVVRDKRGKEQFYKTSAKGAELCQSYRKIREACLVESMKAIGIDDPAEIRKLATTLRALSGLYDQAARAATSL